MNLMGQTALVNSQSEDFSKLFVANRSVKIFNNMHAISNDAWQRDHMPPATFFAKPSTLSSEPSTLNPRP